MVFAKSFKSSLLRFTTLTLVSKSIEIKAPVDTVFTYIARPEHDTDQLKDQERVGMTVIPMDI